MKRNLFRNLIGGVSLSAAMFAFQACYGTPQDFGLDVHVKGKVVSKQTGQPIEGIKISVQGNPQYEWTDANGDFSFYTEREGDMILQFRDIDSVENGQFMAEDTVIKHPSEEIYLNIKLSEQ